MPSNAETLPAGARAGVGSVSSRKWFAASYLCAMLAVFGLALRVLPEPWNYGIAFAAAADFGRVAERLLPLHEWVAR